MFSVSEDDLLTTLYVYRRGRVQQMHLAMVQLRFLASIRHAGDA